MFHFSVRVYSQIESWASIGTGYQKVNVNIKLGGNAARDRHKYNRNMFTNMDKIEIVNRIQIHTFSVNLL